MPLKSYLKLLLQWFGNLGSRWGRAARRAGLPWAGPESELPAADKLRALRRTYAPLLGVNPHGFEPFDPTAHHALPAIQRQVAAMLFGRFGLEWVPSEYMGLLVVHPDPIVALRKYCRRFGLNVELLRAQNPSEIAYLQQCVGIQLELGILTPNRKVRDEIYDRLMHRNYKQAEELLRILRTIGTLLSDVQRLDGQVIFPDYIVFASRVRLAAADPLALTADDAEEGRVALHSFIERHERFTALIQQLDYQIGWVQTNWPDNAWGKDTRNIEIRLGLVATKEDLERVLHKSTDEELAEFGGIDGCLDQLESIIPDLLDFVDEIRRNTDVDYKPPADDPAMQAETYKRMCDVLGLTEAEGRDPDALKKKFRKLALANHPDRVAGLSDAEKRKRAEFFAQVTAAYHYLDAQPKS